MPIRVFVVGAHQAVREALVIRLKSFPELEVVGAVPTLEEAPALTTSSEPDVILFDLQGVAARDSSALTRLASSPGVSDRIGAPPAVIALASYMDEEEREWAFQAGARQYVLKAIDSNHLLAEIRAAATGRTTSAQNAAPAERSA